MGRYTSQRKSWTLLLVLVQVVGVVTLPLWLWTWTVSALSQADFVVVLGAEVTSSVVPLSPFPPNETREMGKKSLNGEGDKSPEGEEVVSSSLSGVTTEENIIFLPTAMKLASPPECHPVYAFDTVGPYRQEEAKSRPKEKIYYYRETDTNEEEESILTKDEFGLVCFTKMINCSVPATATAASRKTPNCVYFSKEFCTRKYGGMKWKGSVCPTTLINQQDYKCKLRALGDVGGVEVAGTTNGKNKTLNCRNSEALCLGLKPPFHTRSGSSDRNPPTQTMCLCPLGYTGPACSRMDIDLFHLDLLHNVDLRNILLKYQQKDRYFIGVTLLFLLVVTLTSVLLIVAGCSFLCSRLPNFLKTMKQLTSDIPYFSRPRASHRQSSTPHRNHHTQTEEQGVEIEDTIKGGSHRNQNTRGASSILCQMSSRMVTMCQSCLNRREEGEEDEDYYDSDLELRFHRARMERRQRLSQRGRVSV